MQLALAQPSKFPHINQLAELTPPAFNGTVDEFIAMHGKKLDANILNTLFFQTKNKVKICTSCGKSCAFTLANCNSCGFDLTQITYMSYTNNVFTGFIYGIAKGPFPFFISLRSQSPNILVFDDLLQLTTCHLNCIPTDVYIPDLRSLFENPTRGLALLLVMRDSAWNVALEQYLGNEEWRTKIMKNSNSLSDDELKSHVCAGLNYPPSQYQLHLQFMLPPFTPFHWNLYQQGGHFTPRRFFPIEYMLEVLEKMSKEKKTIPNASSMDIDVLIDLIQQEYAIEYDAMHTTCYNRYGASHLQLSNWSPEDFDGIVQHNGTVQMTNHNVNDTGYDNHVLDIKVVAVKDKMVLQNYGRPYNVEHGRPCPSGTYYKYPKKQIPLATWN